MWETRAETPAAAFLLLNSLPHYPPSLSLIPPHSPLAAVASLDTTAAVLQLA